MIIPEVAPMLTCTQINDGYLYELQVHAAEGQEPITKIKIGPYYFKDNFRPRPGLFGIGTVGGPDSGFWMHKSTPRGWSRITWEIDNDAPGRPVYIVSRGALNPGTQGLFQFVSLHRPGGLRAGLEIYRTERHTDCGVSGPDYHRFSVSDHDH